MNNSKGFRDAITGFFGVFDELKALFNELWAIVTRPEVIQFFKDLGSAIAAIVLDNIRNLIKGLSRIVNIINAIIEGDWKRAGAEALEFLKENNPLEIIRRNIEAVDEATGGKISSGVDKFLENNLGSVEIPEAGKDLLKKYGVGEYSSAYRDKRNITTNTDIKIDIHSTDPVEAGQEVRDKISPIFDRSNAGKGGRY